MNTISIFSNFILSVINIDTVFYNIKLEEKSQNFASKMFSPSFLVIHNTSTCCQNHITVEREKKTLNMSYNNRVFNKHLKFFQFLRIFFDLFHKKSLIVRE